jgi:hypothetical protein
MNMHTKRRRPGRPSLPPNQKRDCQLPLYFSPRELDLLQRRANRVGLPAHVLARDLALYGRVEVPPVPRANYAVVGQLGRIGGLLNQALRQVNSGRLAPELRPLIQTTLETLAALRRELINSEP